MAPTFSKPVLNPWPPGTCKMTISTLLSSGNNVDDTTIKKRKLAAATREAQRLAALHTAHQPSVENEDDPQDMISYVGHHTHPGVLLEKDVTELTDDDGPIPELEEPQWDEEELEEEAEVKPEEEETEDEEIGMSLLHQMD